MEAAARRKEEAAEAEVGLSSPPRKKALDAYTEWMRKFEAEAEAEDDWSDYLALRAANFEAEWNYLWADKHGSFEAETSIRPSRFTDGNPMGRRLRVVETLQFFRVKIARIKGDGDGDLQWPLRVYGLVAARDSFDRNRNYIFRRSRDDCQILTEGFPYLKLTGPTRAIVVVDPVVMEVDLKVKGNTSKPEEDYHLSSLAVHLNRGGKLHSFLVNEAYSSKLSTLELTFGHIVSSVEATIVVRVIDGKWPAGFSGRFGARTKSIANAGVVLLNSGGDQVPVDADGMIKLSRRVVSVELTGLLVIDVEAFDDWGPVVESTKEFTPMKDGRSHYTVQVGPCCEIQVTVAWSLFNKHPDD